MEQDECAGPDGATRLTIGGCHFGSTLISMLRVPPPFGTITDLLVELHLELASMFIVASKKLETSPSSKGSALEDLGARFQPGDHEARRRRSA